MYLYHYRWNETLPTPEYTAENAFEALREKVHLQWRDIAKVFYFKNFLTFKKFITFEKFYW